MQNNLTKYQSHLAWHISKAIERQNHLFNLENDEADTMCNYKVKFLSKYFCQQKQQHFRKSSISCQAFMMIITYQKWMFMENVCNSTKIIFKALSCSKHIIPYICNSPLINTMSSIYIIHACIWRSWPEFCQYSFALAQCTSPICFV